MPYIDPALRGSAQFAPQTPGELNYAIHCLFTTYVGERGLNYQTLNDIIGALECSKLEFYRRLAVPYEDRKLVQNGDITVYKEMT